MQIDQQGYPMFIYASFSMDLWDITKTCGVGAGALELHSGMTLGDFFGTCGGGYMIRI